MNPQYREMMLGDELTPVSELSGAFLQPKSPLHLQFAYFESSLVVEYLVEKHGLDTLKRVLVDLGVGMPINESLARYAGSIETLDAEFRQVRPRTGRCHGARRDWSEPELPRRATPEMVAAWVKEHPTNYAALRLQAKALIAAQKWTEAKTPLEKMRGPLPQDAGADNAVPAAGAGPSRAEGHDEERAALEKLAELSADDVESFARLTELTAEAGDWEASRDVCPPVAGGQSALAWAAPGRGGRRPRNWTTARWRLTATGRCCCWTRSIRPRCICSWPRPCNKRAICRRPSGTPCWPWKRRPASGPPTSAARNRRPDRRE